MALEKSNHWEKVIKHAEIRMREKSYKEKDFFTKVVDTAKKFLTVELLVGIIAAFSMYMQFGWLELERTLLSWIIGITLVATLLTVMVNRYRRITHNE